jgi:pimeloyl-ACP methyl ester carboxylesterase
MECKLNNITLFYEEAGSGKPIIMLHGWPLDHRHIFSDMEPLFRERIGWRRIYPDLPGMGRTIGPDWITHQDQVLEILLAFIEKVAPSARITVAGVSYGGYLARGLVHQMGSRMDGVFLSIPHVETNESRTNYPKHQVIRRDDNFLAALRPEEEYMKEMVVSQSMELLHDFRESINPASAIADHEFLKRLEQHYAFSFAVDSPPEPFQAPALILTGRYDNWCGYREAFQILDNYPRATYAVLDCAGHSLPMEQRTLYQALVGEWLDRVNEYREGRT